MYLRTSLFFLLLLLFSVLIGCGGAAESSPSQNGTISLYLTDSPGKYKAVYITIKEVHIQKDSGEWRLISIVNKTYDLLSLRSGIRSPLGMSDLSEGTYTQLRLLLSTSPDSGKNLLHEPHPYANYVLLNDNTTQELKVPSAIKRGIKLKGEFGINPDRKTIVTLDFDAEKSIIEAGKSGQWLLKPVIKTIPEAEFEKKIILEGTVRESSGRVLEGVKIALQKNLDDAIELEAVSFSDTKGNYHFHVKENTYILVAYKEGYLPLVSDLNLTRQSRLDITLNEARDTGTLTLKAISGTIEGSARISLRQNLADLSYELIGINISSGFNEVLRIPQGVYSSHAEYDGRTQSQEISISNGDNLEWVTVF